MDSRAARRATKFTFRRYCFWGSFSQPPDSTRIVLVPHWVMRSPKALGLKVSSYLAIWPPTMGSMAWIMTPMTSMARSRTSLIPLLWSKGGERRAMAAPRSVLPTRVPIPWSWRLKPTAGSIWSRTAFRIWPSGVARARASRLMSIPWAFLRWNRWAPSGFSMGRVWTVSPSRMRPDHPVVRLLGHQGIEVGQGHGGGALVSVHLGPEEDRDRALAEGDGSEGPPLGALAHDLHPEEVRVLHDRAHHPPVRVLVEPSVLQASNPDVVVEICEGSGVRGPAGEGGAPRLDRAAGRCRPQPTGRP